MLNNCALFKFSLEWCLLQSYPIDLSIAAQAQWECSRIHWKYSQYMYLTYQEGALDHFCVEHCREHTPHTLPTQFSFLMASTCNAALLYLILALIDGGGCTIHNIDIRNRDLEIAHMNNIHVVS